MPRFLQQLPRANPTTTGNLICEGSSLDVQMLSLVEVPDAGVSLQGHNMCEAYVLSVQAHACCAVCAACTGTHELGMHCLLPVVSTFATTRVALFTGGTTK